MLEESGDRLVTKQILLTDAKGGLADPYADDGNVNRFGTTRCADVGGIA